MKLHCVDNVARGICFDCDVFCLTVDCQNCANISDAYCKTPSIVCANICHESQIAIWRKFNQSIYSCAFMPHSFLFGMCVCVGDENGRKSVRRDTRRNAGCATSICVIAK